MAWLGAFVSCILFQGPEIWRTVKLRWRREKVHEDKVNYFTVFESVGNVD